MSLERTAKSRMRGHGAQWRWQTVCIQCESLIFLPKLTHAAARVVCDSWPTCTIMQIRINNNTVEVHQVVLVAETFSHTKFIFCKEWSVETRYCINTACGRYVVRAKITLQSVTAHKQYRPDRRHHHRWHRQEIVSVNHTVHTSILRVVWTEQKIGKYTQFHERVVWLHGLQVVFAVCGERER